MIVDILNNKTVWRFLALASYSPGAGYTRNEIMKSLKMNNLSLDRTLKKLEFYKIITKDKRLIKVNFDNSDTKVLLDLIENDKKKLNYPTLDIYLLICDFLMYCEGKKIDSMYLFGSHAKKTASINSDIDIAVFSRERVNLIIAKDKIEQEYGKNIELHYFTVGEKGKLVSEVLKHGVKIY